MRRVETACAAALTRLYADDDPAAFQEFLALTEEAVVVIANDLADRLGYCLGLEQPVGDVYASFLLDMHPKPAAVQHALREIHTRLAHRLSHLVEEIAAVEIARERGSEPARIADKSLPKPLEEVQDDFVRIVHVCTHRLDTKHRRVLRYRQTLRYEYDRIGQEMQLTPDAARELYLDAMELLDTSMTVATGSDA